MIALTRRGPMLAGIALIAALAVLATTISTQNAWSASYKSCSLSESEQNPSNDKPTYVLSVKRKNTSCKTAKKVARSYHACRTKLGTACNRKVRTYWSCTARKTSSSSLSFYATATCKWGTRRVRTSYQQNK